MGTQPGIPGYELGIPCIPCLGFNTPKRFLAIVDGIQKCPGHLDDPSGFFVLTQIAACNWRYQGPVFVYLYDAITPFPPGGSAFNIGTAFGSWFAGANAGICTTSFTNQHVVGDCGGPSVDGYGGSVGLLFGPGI